MNIEHWFSSHRFRIGSIVYWIVIAVLMYFCSAPPQNGHAGHGKGPGAGDGGNGPGAGTGPGSSYQAPASGAGNSAGEPKKEEPVKVMVPDTAKRKAIPEQKTPPAAPAVSQKVSAPPATEPPPKPVPAPEVLSEFSAAPAAPAPPAAPADGGGTKKGFFGVDVVNEGNVLFVLDVSGSMASTTADSSTRIELLKKELIEMLDSTAAASRRPADRDSSGRSMLNGSSRTQYFRIITFSCSVSYFPDVQQKALCFARKEDVENAKKYARSLTTGGGTAMKLAWGNPRTVELLKKSFFQTAYFLTDGEPTDCREPELLSLLKQKYPKLKIHTFSMGTSSKLLKDTADQHHGKYKEIY